MGKLVENMDLKFLVLSKPKKNQATFFPMDVNGAVVDKMSADNQGILVGALHVMRQEITAV